MKSVSHIILAALLGTGTAVANEGINFDKHDENNDGYLAHDEWSDVSVSFNDIDADGDKLVTREEIRQSQLQLEGDRGDRQRQAGMQQTGAQQDRQAQQQRTGQQNRQGRQAFQQADRNRDNRVAEDEARQAGYDYVVYYFDTIDADGDGYLDENEWDLNEYGAGRYDTGANNNFNNDTAGFENRDDTMDIGMENGAFEDDEFGYENTNFDYYDTNDDGFLDENEVGEDDYLKSNFDTWDENDDGLIDVGEANDDFMEWNENAFGTYDANDDGILDEDEAANNDYVDANFDTWDANNDGFLDEDEASDTWYNDDDTYYEEY